MKLRSKEMFRLTQKKKKYIKKNRKYILTVNVISFQKLNEK